MAQKRKRRARNRLPELSVAQILAWADDFHQRTGRWPKKWSGWIAGSLGDKWSRVNQALARGHRGLPGRSSLARLLAEHRGVRNHMNLPRLSLEHILAWADAHQQRTGNWPHPLSGPIPDAPGETWMAAESALRYGCRGLPGDSSLARLLAEHRGVRNIQQLPPLTLEQIVAWADACYQRTGRWPRPASGPIADAPGETWVAVETALRDGYRGLTGGSSLARLLAEHRGVRNIQRLPKLTPEQIVTWADAFHQRTGYWPHLRSGPIEEAPGETWKVVHTALDKGARGLPGGSSLARLLAERRGVRNHMNLRSLTAHQILVWADAHHHRLGKWPSAKSGPVLDAPGETWLAMDAALRYGRRGLAGGLSLARLLGIHGRTREPVRTCCG